MPGNAVDPSALLDAMPMLALPIVPCAPLGVLAPPCVYAKIGLMPAFRISSTALWYAVLLIRSCHALFAAASAEL